MPVTIISPAAKLATGINVFTLPAERQPALIETLNAISNEIITHKYPMNVSANFHRSIDAPIVINYNQYNDRKSGQFLRTQPVAKAMLDKTHDLSDEHELRWYEVDDVVTTAQQPGDRLEISEQRKNLAVIGIFAVEPAKQDDLLALLKRYGESLKAAQTPGFVGIALHRGFKLEHVASYEQWTSSEAYRQWAGQGGAEAIKQIRAMASTASLHQYDVLSVQRFDLD